MAIKLSSIQWDQPASQDAGAPDFSKVVWDDDDRSIGTAVADTGRALASGVGTVVEGFGNLYGLATGDMNNAATGLGQSVRDYWSAGLSPQILAKRAARSRAVAEQDGVLAQFLTAAGETIKDPALLVDTTADTAASFLPGAAAGRVGSALTLALRGRQAMDAAGKVGTAAAIGTGGAMAGADVIGDLYSRAMDLPDEVWLENPEFVALAEKVGVDEAKHQIALHAARMAFPGVVGLSVASQKLVPGGATIERFMGGAAPAAGTAVQRAGRVVTGSLGEGTQEAIEEGGGRAIGNLAMRFNVDPTQEVGEGVGEAAGLGFAGSLGLGGAAGLAQRPVQDGEDLLSGGSVRDQGAPAAPRSPGPVPPVAAESVIGAAPDAADIGALDAALAAARPQDMEAPNAVPGPDPVASTPPAVDGVGAAGGPAAAARNDASAALDASFDYTPRLAELRKRAGQRTPEETAEYARLLEVDRTTTKVGGKPIFGVQNFTKFEDDKAEGTLKPFVLISDADNFKAINDTYGHQLGDEVIRVLGETLRDAMSEVQADSYHRSGDEFLAAGADADTVRKAAERANELMRDITIEFPMPDGSVRSVTGVQFSYGIGRDETEAEAALHDHKAQRAAQGLRTERGADRRQQPGRREAEAGSVPGELGRGADGRPVAGATPTGETAGSASGTQSLGPRAEPEKHGLPKPLKPRQKKSQPKDFDPNYDDLLDFIALNGGMHREVLAREGVDPAEWTENGRRNQRFIGKPVFKKGRGMTVSDLRERMQEAGFLPEDPVDRPPEVGDDDALQLLMDALGGRVVQTAAGADVSSRIADIEAQEAAQAQDAADAGLARELGMAPEALQQELEAAEAADLLREFGAEFDPQDEAEALAIADLVRRAYDAGVDPIAVLDITFDAPAAQQARELWALIKEKEASRGPDTEAVPVDREGGPEAVQGGQGRPAAPTAAERQPAEPESEQQPAEPAAEPADRQAPGLTLTAPAAPPAASQSAPPASQGGLFAPPTRGEVIEAAKREKDAQRNGQNTNTRTDMMAGEGELFAGPRPEQVDVQQAAIVGAAQRSAQAGGSIASAWLRDAKALGVDPDDGQARRVWTDAFIDAMPRPDADEAADSEAAAEASDPVQDPAAFSRDEQTEKLNKGAADALASMSEAELSAMFDEIAAETDAVPTELPEKERADAKEKKAPKAAPKKSKGERKPPKAPTRSPAEKIQSEGRSAADMAKSLGVNLSSGGVEALKGLSKLFGGPGRLNSGLTFDEQTYAAAKPHFQTMLRDFEAAGRDVRDLVREMIRLFGTGVKPYLMRFAQEIRAERAGQGATDELAPGVKATYPADDGMEFRVARMRDGNHSVVLVDIEAGQAVDTAIIFRGTDSLLKAKEYAQEQARKATAGASLTQRLLAAVNRDGMPADNNALRRMVSEIDGSPADNARLKEAQEALEAVIVMRAREIVEQGGDDRTTFDRLLELYQSQPNLNIRTSTSVENQAYSTPAPLAFLNARLAGVDQATTVLEPTAGTGMLLITADPANVKANELEPGRVALLREAGFTTTTQDAAVGNILPPGERVDAVLANPPFGSVKGADGRTAKAVIDGYKIGKIDHLIVANALESLADDGTASFIIGADKVAGGIANDDRIFFNWLYSHYNVVGHFEVDGALYNRQGAGWPVRVITVSGRLESDRISPEPGQIERATTWEQVYEQYEKALGAIDRQQPVNQGAADRSGVGTNDAAGTGRGGRGQGASTGRSGRASSGSRGTGNVRGTSAGAVGNRPAGEGSGVRPGTGGVGLDDGATRGGGLAPGASRAAALGGTGRGAEGANTRVPDRKPVAQPETTGNEFQTPYIPRSSRKDGGVLVPVNMAQPLQDALSALEDAVGDIDQFVVDELGYGSVQEMHDALMGLQVDSVAAAIHQIKNREKAVVIADQTGIGKGRQAAAMIRWAQRSGYVPVFVTVKPSLFTDMFNDLADIGSNDIEPFVMNADAWITAPSGERLFSNRPSSHRNNIRGIAASGELPEGRNALFLTYSQINTENSQRAALTALAPNAVLILDESHNAGGASQTGEFVQGVLAQAKGAVYLSATFAKRPDNMPVYFRTDIGDAIGDGGTLMNAMESGGLPLQTVVSNALVRAGQMFRRERSYDGVSITTLTDSENRAKHEALSDATTEALRAIVDADRAFHANFFKELEKRLKEEAKGNRAIDGAGNRASQRVDHTQFSSVVHNFVRQMLLGLKADRAADEAIAALERGQKPLIAVENTMGSFLAAYVDAEGLTQGDPLTNFDYRTVLTRALARSRYYMREDRAGNKVRTEVPLKELDHATRAAYDRAQQIIDRLDVDIPVSPIDWIRNRITQAGYTAAEITGRSLSVDYSDGVPKLSQVPIEEQRDKTSTTRRFNNGKLDALILNVAGSTGISLHASERFEDQRPRHMIVAQAAQDINIFMQMLGRIHRTGQVALPSYTILNVDLPAEKRPTALLNKKMKSLNANTSSNTESATSIKSADILNKYGDQVVTAYLREEVELARQIGMEPGGDGTESPEASAAANEDVARKATGRIALLPVDSQHKFYDEVEAQYQALIEYLDSTNQNELEPKTFDFEAEPVKESVLVEASDPTTPFGEEAVYGEYLVKAQGKPMTPDEIDAAMGASLDGARDGAAHADALIDRIANVEVQRWDGERAKNGLGKAFDEETYRRALASYGFSESTIERMVDMAASEYRAGRAVTYTPQQILESATSRNGVEFMRGHAIGSMWRVDINGDVYNAVVTNLRNTHRGTGNPFSLSKIQVTIAVNGPLRSLTVPASQWSKIEVAPLYGISIPAAFSGGVTGRETAKIVTGNLLAAYGELTATRGTVVSFTRKDGTVAQGILLPKRFVLEENTRGDLQIKTAEDVRRLLTETTNEDVRRFGVASRDQTVRITPRPGGQFRIWTPRSKARGGKYFLDRRLTDITGDFVSSGDGMTVTVGGAQAIEAFSLLMQKAPLYAGPEIAKTARAALGYAAPERRTPDGDAPSTEVREDAATYERTASDLPDRQQRGADAPRVAASRARPAATVHGDQLELFAAQGAKPAYSFARRAGLREVGRLSTGIERVKAWTDAAHILAPIRKNAQEVIAALVVDSKGKPLGVIEGGVGVVDGASVEPWSLLGAIYSIPDAAAVYFAHNHPSGIPDQSAADRALTMRIAEIMSGSGVDLRGMIVVAPGTRRATLIESDPSENSLGAMKPEQSATVPAARRRASVPVSRRVLKMISDPGAAINSNSDALRYADDARKAAPAGALGAIMLDTRHRVVGSVVLTNQRLRTGNPNTGVGAVLKAFSEANASAAILWGGNDETLNLGNALMQADVRVLDRISPDPMQGGEPVSMAGRGRPMGSHRIFFSLGNRRDGRALPTDNVRRIAESVLGVDAVERGVEFPRFSELPAAIREEVARLGVPQEQVRAVHWRGKTYMVADRFADRDAVERALFHEHYGHFGLSALWNGDKARELSRLLDRVGGLKGALALAKKQGIDLGDYVRGLEQDTSKAPEVKRQILMEELLAHMAEATGSLLRTLQEWLGKVRAWLRDNGYLSLSNYGASDLAHVLKQAREAAARTSNAGDAVPAFQLDEAAGPAPVFYSALAESVARAQGAPRKGSPAAWKQWLDGAQRRGEFKQSERDWLGVDAWLDAQDKPVPREALAEFVRSNEVQVRDVVLGNALETLTIGELRAEWERVYKKPGGAWDMSRDEMIEMLRGEPDGPGSVDGEAKYRTYRTPGGENYRELLLTLPRAMSGDRLLTRKEVFDKYRSRIADAEARANTFGDTEVRLAAQRELETLYDQRDREAEQVGAGDVTGYKSSHWDQPNVLAHVRFDERTDADGKRVLFLQEIQSDWHQDGRRKGYAGLTADEQAKKKRLQDTPFSEWTDEEIDWFNSRVNDASRYGVPNAPLKQTDEWAMLAFKRMARWAVDNGFDRIAWTTGEMAADLFDLSKQVSEIDWVDGGSGARVVSIAPLGSNAIEFRVNKEGVAESEQFRGRNIADVVGKDIADKIMGEPFGSLSGDGLKVGGEGMRGFYDKILPAAVGKWAKKFGARVGTANVPGKTGEWVTGADGMQRRGREQIPVHSIDITPQMREAVTDGQPMFSIAPQSEAQRNQASMLDALGKGQPLDRLIRKPFDVLGLLDSHGRMKAGVSLSATAERVLTQAKFSADGRMAWMNPMLETVRAGLVDRYGLTEGYIQRDAERQADERKIALQAMDIVKRLAESGIGIEESRVLQAILTGEQVAEGDYVKLAAPIRAAVDEMGREAVDLGLISPESYERNRGSYLHRVYMKHEAVLEGSRLAKWVNDGLASRRRKIVGNSFKGRGMDLKVTMAELQRGVPGDWWKTKLQDGKADKALKGAKFIVLDRLAPIGEGTETAPGFEEGGPRRRRNLERVHWPAELSLPARFETWENRGEWEVRDVIGGKAVLWRDFTKPERESMGEIVDARYTIAKTFQLMAHDLSTARFFKDIALNPEWASQKEPEGVVIDAVQASRLRTWAGVDWVKVPDITIPKSRAKKYGQLSGAWVRAEIWRDIAELERMQEPGLWQAVMTQWKLNKTARSPVVHMNNIVSNFVFMDMADVRLQDLVRGLYAYTRDTKEYRDALEHGAFGSSMITQEIRRTVLEPLLQEILAENRNAGGVEGRMAVLGKLADRLWSGVKAFDDRMTSLYQLEDEVFRMATYMRRLTLGDTPAEAATTARDQFLNYDIRAPWINTLRRTVLPFIGYTYRAVPVIARSISHRPWKLAKYATIAYVANALAYMLAPGDEDEERRSMRPEVQGYTWIGVPRMLRMPWRDEHGMPVFLDIRRWIPAGDVFDTNQGQSALPIPAPIQFGGPLMLGAELALNKQAFTGDPITNELTDTTGEKVEKVASWAWKSWMPGAAWIPGSWYWDKIERAAGGGRDMLGRDYSLAQALASSAGIKLSPQDVAFGMQVHAWQFERTARELKAQARQLGQDKARGLISDADFNREMRNIEAKFRHLGDRARDTFSGNEADE